MARVRRGVCRHDETIVVELQERDDASDVRGVHIDDLEFAIGAGGGNTELVAPAIASADRLRLDQQGSVDVGEHGRQPLDHFVVVDFDGADVNDGGADDCGAPTAPDGATRPLRTRREHVAPQRLAGARLGRFDEVDEEVDEAGGVLASYLARETRRAASSG